MAVLERRVQVLFDSESYAQLEAWAQKERRSVGSIVRDSVAASLDARRSQKTNAYEQLIRLAREHPDTGPAMTEDDWRVDKHLTLTSPALDRIPFDLGLVRGRDAVHVATAQRHGITTILTTDTDFDGIPGLTRLDPRSPELAKLAED